jgi:hypothetical protein
VGRDRLEEPGPDARDPVETLQVPERSVLLPVCDDGLGQPQSDPGKAGELAGAGGVDINHFAGCKRSGSANGTIALSQRGSGRKSGEQLDLTRRLPGPGGQMAYALAGHRQGEKDQQCPTFRRSHEGR